MKIAVISEVSARDKNSFIINALAKRGCEIANVGMQQGDFIGEHLTYIHTGLIAGILINLGAVDFVVGGCGTGQGFMISAMQYPKVFCGLVESPLDAWLFTQINAGNCLSLALSKGFGWASDINIDYIFEKLFADSFGQGYPQVRKESQQISRSILNDITSASHKTIEQILPLLDKEIVKTVCNHKPFVELVKGNCSNVPLQKFIIENYMQGNL